MATRKNRAKWTPGRWVKRARGDTWHFELGCSKWPHVVAETRTKKPTSGELCNECRAKAKARG